MPSKIDKLTVKDLKGKDRRVKLTPEDKENIRKDYATGLFSQRDLASKYKVSRRTIQFAINPDTYDKSREQFKERRKDGRYYNREEHTEYMRNHREYKESLLGGNQHE